jgi:hypothetical protein
MLQQEGTLIGTALLTCFSYWISTSVVIATMAYVFLCDLPIVTIAATIVRFFKFFSQIPVRYLMVFYACLTSLQGYALFGHCIVVALTALFHPLHDHLYFFALLTLFAGASCLRMVSAFVCTTMWAQRPCFQGVIFASKARHRTHKLILLITTTILHCTFLAYLHFGFETMVEGWVHVYLPNPLPHPYSYKP